MPAQVQSMKVEAPLKDGDTQAQLMKAREIIRKAVGPETVKEWLAIDWFYEFWLDLVFPPAALAMLWWWMYRVDPWDPIQFILTHVVAGWIAMNHAGIAHDMNHRLPYGKFLSSVWARVCVLPSTNLDETWLRRHLLHHRFTFEPGDTKLLRTVQSKGKGRFWSHIPYIHGKQYFERKDHYKTTKYISQVKPSMNWLMFDKLCVFCFYLAAVTCFGVGKAIFLWHTYGFGIGLFSGFRYLLEHGAQDHENPLSQGTFYESGWLLKFLYFGVPQGDCHIVHHLYPTMPHYNILFKATKKVNKVLEANGVKKYTSMWWLLKQWWVTQLPYATVW